MIIEVIKEIERAVGLDIIINFLMFICGIGIGASITDAINNKDKNK